MAYNQIFSDSELSLFCYQFSVVLRSGIPYMEAIHLLSDEIMDPKMKPYINDIAKRVQDGESLSLAFKAQNVFPVYLEEMVQISENTGKVPEILEQLSDYYEHNDQLRQKVKSALTYPLVLIGLMGAVILLLIVKVLPIFHDILTSVGGEIPTATQWILDFSRWLQSGIVAMLVVLAMLLLGILFVLKSRYSKKLRDKLLLKTPVVGKLYKQALVVRFAKALSMLVHSGIDSQKALGMIQPLLDNEMMSVRIGEATNALKNGENLHVALKNIKLFPELFIKMVQVGEKSGVLDATMAKVSSIYEKELNRSLQRVTVAIEPTLVIALSVIVGAIMLLVMLPLINIMSSIG